MPSENKTEVLPPVLRGTIPDMRAMLDKLVEEKVAEIMSKDSPAIFQPYFQSRRVAKEVRKNQTVSEQTRWSDYFKKWGCDVCGTRERQYGGLGRCHDCYERTQQRLEALRRSAAEKNTTVQDFADRQGDLARAALQPLSPPLPPEKRLDLEGIARESLRPAQKALPGKETQAREVGGPTPVWTIKRIDRLEMPRQLRVDDETGRRIRMRADLNRRTIQLEILHLLDLGLKGEPEPLEPRDAGGSRIGEF